MSKNCEGCGSISICHALVGNITFEDVVKEFSLDDSQMTFEFVNSNLFEFTKTRDVKSPSRGSEKSAGIDFYVPNDYDSIELGPGERILIPAGVKVKLPANMALMFVNKSGVASKRGLDVLACLVDEDYHQEVHINLVNTGTGSVWIEPGEKIVQGVLIPTYYFDIKELSNVDYESTFEKTSRNGGFGSTGTK